MGMAMFFQLVAGLPSVLLAAFAFWVCYRHRHLSPWIWCLLVGLAGILSKTAFHGLFLLLAVVQEFGINGQALGGEFLEGGYVGLFLSGVAGWLGECTLLLGIPMVIRDLAGQFQLWKELQAGAPGGESD
jgi:hypothetical protein